MTFHRAKVADANDRYLELQQAAETAGAQRTKAAAILGKIGKNKAFTVPYGRQFVHIAGDGTMWTPPKAKAEEVASEMDDYSTGRAWIHPDLVAAATLGSAGLNKIVDGAPVPYGVCVLVAGSGVGKTPFAHYLASANSGEYGVVRIGEPFAGYTTNQGEAARGIGEAACAYSDVVVDSIKDLLAQSGNAMKGGLARAALADLSFWSILGATIGTTFYVPLNPSTGDADSLNLLVEAARSNASMTIANVGAGETWNYTSRLGEGLERRTGQLKQKAPTPKPKDSGFGRSFIVDRDPFELSRTEFAGAVHRATLNK